MALKFIPTPPTPGTPSKPRAPAPEERPVYSTVQTARAKLRRSDLFIAPRRQREPSSGGATWSPGGWATTAGRWHAMFARGGTGRSAGAEWAWGGHLAINRAPRWGWDRDEGRSKTRASSGGATWWLGGWATTVGRWHAMFARGGTGRSAGAEWAWGGRMAINRSPRWGWGRDEGRSKTRASSGGATCL